MKHFLTEKNFVVVLFLLVVVVFSFAQKESKKIEHLYKTMAISPDSPAFSKYNAQLTLEAGTAATNPVFIK